MKRVLSLFLIFILTVSSAGVFADNSTSAAIDTAKNVYNQTPNPTVSSIGGEWAVLGLARGGFGIPDSYFDTYCNNLKNYVKERNGVLHEKKYTEYSRVIIALTAIGKNPADVGGYNLLLPLTDYESTITQGINGAIWALIAFDCGNYGLSPDSNASFRTVRSKYTDKILSMQNADGGWSLIHGSSDADITAMALCALSKYQSRDDVVRATNSALDFLSSLQNADGGFSDGDGDNSENTAQVITALCELGISSNDDRFVKNGKTLADNLMQFYGGNGGFKHRRDDETANRMSTEQALCALSALKRLREGKTPLYSMNDAVRHENDVTESTDNSPGRNPDIIKKSVIQEKTFDDIANNSAKEYIEALASREIINGKSDTLFEPDSSMTRAEFAAITVRSLGLASNGEKLFADVGENDWFFPFVTAAYKYGIVSGISETEFNPYGLITREEAAVMISRAAKLCGLNTEYESSVIRDLLSEFTDYMSTSDWARGSLAFCVDKKIIPIADTELKPKTAVTRAEIAAMLYKLLECADLL